MPIVEKAHHEDLILYEILSHPVLCGEFINNIDKLDWEEPFEFTDYQKEFICDFNPYVSLSCARAVGKTLSLVNIIIWILINNIFPGDYILYTVPNKVHLEPVFTGLIRMFRSNTILKQFIEPNKGINSSDYKITLKNTATLLCRIAGQSGTGANVIGLHTPFEIADETGYYPWGTWIELQPTLNTFTSGFRMVSSGVPTGLRENNVLYSTDQIDSNYTKHNISALENPRFSEEDEEKAAVQYGGRDSDDYIHLVLGEHGKPVFSLFDRALMELATYPVYKLTLDGIKMQENIADYFTKLSLFPALPDKSYNCIFGIDLGYCYSEDTEVLTKRGWLKHNDLEENDIIATYDTKKDKIIWDGFEYLWEQEYRGKMIEVDGKLTNFMVSPEHSVWVNRLKGNKVQEYEKLKAKDLLTLKNNRFRVRISAENENRVGEKFFNVPYYYCDRKDRPEANTKVDVKVWLQFLAWFISEGSATNNRSWEINLTQAKDRYTDEIDKVLEQLPYKVHRKEFITQWGNTQVVWQITCKELCLWLRENCGVHSQNKKIPDFVFDCSTEDQELFLRTLLLGDGSRVNSNRSPVYGSQSKKLLDQVQHLAVSLGYYSSTSFYEKDNIGRTSIIPKREIELHRDNNVKEIDYEGKIYCLKTSTGFYVTRRKGKIAVQGNTEPTAINILYVDNYGRIKFHGRIRLNKVSYSIQDRFIDALDSKYNPSIIGIDEGSAGKAVIQRLQEATDFAHKNYKKKMIPINFSSWISLGIDSNGEEIKSKTKPFAVSVLQDYSNNHKIVYSTTDLEMITELERMTYSKTQTGEIVYRTLTERGGKKGEDHFSAALLCGILAYYLENESFTQSPRKKLFTGKWFVG